TDCDVEALLHLAAWRRLVFAGIGRGLGDQPALCLERLEHVERGALADNQIVTAIVDSVPLAHADPTATIRVAGEAQAAHHAVAVQGAVVEPQLLPEVDLLGREVVIGEELAAEVVGSLEADRLAARARSPAGTTLAAAGTGTGSRFGLGRRGLGRPGLGGF